jgi:nicotinate-nucleotide adenylyltransferase
MQRPLNKSIGLVGGTFDPAHKGHIAITKIAIRKLKLSKVLWIVTKKKSFKT